MPYATPSPTTTSSSSPVLTTHSLGRPGHRRSYSNTSNLNSPINFSNERGPGAFASLGSLPRRTPSSSSNPGITINTTPAPKFHLNTSSGSSSSDSEEEEDGPPPPLKLKKQASPSFGGVPFPKSSPLSSPIPGDGGDRSGSGLLSPLSGLHSHITSSFGGSSPTPGSPRGSPKPSLGASSHLAPPVRPSPSRTASSPILLSNGKPLKSSLKGSNSTSNIPAQHPNGQHHAQSNPHAHHQHSTHPTHHHHPHHHHHHLRAQSAPSTPFEDTTSSRSTSATSSATNSPTATPKNVHFPSLPTDLEHIRVFNKSAKPISFLRRSSDASRGPNGNIPGAYNSEVEGQETETETETDREVLGAASSAGWGGYGGSANWGGYGSNTWGNSSSWSRTANSNGSRWNQHQPTGSGAGDRMGGGGQGGYPFPRVPSPPQASKQEETLELDIQEGYSAPSTASAVKDAHVVLESLEIRASDDSSSTAASSSDLGDGKRKLKLELTVLVRNVAYEKQVAFRFTMDDWGTVSEVGGKYLESVRSLDSTSVLRSSSAPASATRSGPRNTLGDVLGVLGGRKEGTGSGVHSRSVSESALDTPPAYDRFLISISLNDYLHLENRVMWGVVRYTCPGTGEWWDNNGGKNFRISWKRVSVPKVSPATTNTSSTASTAAAPTPAPPIARERKAGIPVGRSLSAPPAPPASVVAASASAGSAAPPQLTKPDVGKVQAQGEALQHRLSGFSLRNYVSPGAVKKSLPPPSAVEKKEEKKEGTGTHGAGIGLYWPWGSSTVRKETKVTPVMIKDFEYPPPPSKVENKKPESPLVSPGGSASVEVVPRVQEKKLEVGNDDDYFSPSAPTVTGPSGTPSLTPSSSRTSSMSSSTSDVSSLPTLVADEYELEQGMGSGTSTSSSSESLDSLMFGSPPTSAFHHRQHTRFVYGSPGSGGDRVGIHPHDFLDSGYRPGAFGGGHPHGHQHAHSGELNLQKLSSVLDSAAKEEERLEKKEPRMAAVDLPIESPLSPPSPPSPPSPGSPGSSSTGSGSETERPLSSPEPIKTSMSSPSPPVIVTSRLPTSPTVTSTGIPLGGTGTTNGGDSESLYKAFVKQWCFVESPRGGTPVTSPGGGSAGALSREGGEMQVKA